MYAAGPWAHRNDWRCLNSLQKSLASTILEWSGSSTNIYTTCSLTISQSNPNPAYSLKLILNIFSLLIQFFLFRHYRTCMTLQYTDIHQTERWRASSRKIQDFCLLFYTWNARGERRGGSGCWRGMHQSAWKICSEIEHQQLLQVNWQTWLVRARGWLVVGHQNFPGGFWCPTPLLLLIIFSKSTLHSTISIPSLVQTGAILRANTKSWLFQE